jgi:nicotinamidase-related amidase
MSAETPRPSTLRLDRRDVALLVVDAQTKLAAAMPPARLERAVRSWAALLEMAARWKLPTGVSEQYPEGLGRTLPVLLEGVSKVSPPAIVFDKKDFSCVGSPMLELLLQSGRRTIVVAGLETHVCVYQTARDLVDRGLRVFVPADAVASRSDEDREIGLRLIERAGAIVTTTEALLFDLQQRAEGEDWKALKRLVK